MNQTPQPKKKSSSLLRRIFFRLLSWLMVLMLGVTLGLILYAVYLDRIVQEKFDGKRWALPAKVYAQPLELYPGVAVTQQQLIAELKRLGYRLVAQPEQTGSYAQQDARLVVHTRGFLFWDGQESSQLVNLDFSRNRLYAISDATTGESQPLLRLEPALIGSLHPGQYEDRVLVKREQWPPLLVDTLLTVEDRAYYRHWGVNPYAIARAMRANLRAGDLVQGGSTLTQQLVKNFYLTHERTLKRKVNEAIMAVLLEARYGKEAILEAYGNEIYLGQDGRRAVHGFGLASWFYFNRPLNELELPQIALLVGIIRGPSYYNPRRYPQRATKRRNLVLHLLAQQGVITTEQAQQARQAPLGISEQAGNPNTYPHFFSLVKKQLSRDYRPEDLNAEGLRIFTTLDPWTQEQSQQQLADTVARLEQKHQLPANQLQGVVIITDSASGEILALLGDRNQEQAGFNRALDAQRPIGSLIKPVIYLKALQSRNYTLVTPLLDAPIEVPIGEDSWNPENFDHRTHGWVPLYQALARSYNLATVRLGLDLGVDSVEQLLARLSSGRRQDPYPALLLGATNLTPLDVAQLYQTLAAGGFRSPLRTIRAVLNAKGEPLQRYPLTVEQVADPEAVFLLNWVLQEVVHAGTGRALQRLLPSDLAVAGKTGTSNGLRDSWFAGFSGDKVAVVWLGRDDNQSSGLTGSSGALRVWAAVMAQIAKMPLRLPAPADIDYAWVDPNSGQQTDPSCPGSRQLPFLRGTVPVLSGTCQSN